MNQLSNQLNMGAMPPMSSTASPAGQTTFPGLNLVTVTGPTGVGLPAVGMLQGATGGSRGGAGMLMDSSQITAESAQAQAQRRAMMHAAALAYMHTTTQQQQHQRGGVDSLPQGSTSCTTPLALMNAVPGSSTLPHRHRSNTAQNLSTSASGGFTNSDTATMQQFLQQRHRAATISMMGGTNTATWFQQQQRQQQLPQQQQQQQQQLLQSQLKSLGLQYSNSSR